jgi:hypothetical protein
MGQSENVVAINKSQRASSKSEACDLFRLAAHRWVLMVCACGPRACPFLRRAALPRNPRAFPA